MPFVPTISEALELSGGALDDSRIGNPLITRFRVIQLNVMTRGRFEAYEMMEPFDKYAIPSSNELEHIFVHGRSQLLKARLPDLKFKERHELWAEAARMHSELPALFPNALDDLSHGIAMFRKKSFDNSAMSRHGMLFLEDGEITFACLLWFLRRLRYLEREQNVSFDPWLKGQAAEDEAGRWPSVGLGGSDSGSSMGLAWKRTSLAEFGEALGLIVPAHDLFVLTDRFRSLMQWIGHALPQGYGFWTELEEGRGSPSPLSALQTDEKMLVNVGQRNGPMAAAKKWHSNKSGVSSSLDTITSFRRWMEGFARSYAPSNEKEYLLIKQTQKNLKRLHRRVVAGEAASEISGGGETERSENGKESADGREAWEQIREGERITIGHFGTDAFWPLVQALTPLLEFDGLETAGSLDDRSLFRACRTPWIPYVHLSRSYFPFPCHMLVHVNSSAQDPLSDVTPPIAVAMVAGAVPRSESPPLEIRPQWVISYSVLLNSMMLRLASREALEARRLRVELEGARQQAEAFSHELGAVGTFLQVSSPGKGFVWPLTLSGKGHDTLYTPFGQQFRAVVDYFTLLSDSKSAPSPFDEWAGKTLKQILRWAVQWARNAGAAAWAKRNISAHEPEQALKRMARILRAFHVDCVERGDAGSLRLVEHNPARSADRDGKRLLIRWVAKAITAAILNAIQHAGEGETQWDIEPVLAVLETDEKTVRLCVLNPVGYEIQPDAVTSMTGTGAVLDLWTKRLSERGLKARYSMDPRMPWQPNQDEIQRLKHLKARHPEGPFFKTLLEFERSPLLFTEVGKDVAGRSDH